MRLSEKLLQGLQNRLKVGNRRVVHLNSIPGRSRYKLDIDRLRAITEDTPSHFLENLLSRKSLKFKLLWKHAAPDAKDFLAERQADLQQLHRSLENLIYQSETIELEKGINTFGFGFPLLIRRDWKDQKLIVAPILIWSLRIKRGTNAYSWRILRKEEDPIYLNEVLLNHLQADVRLSPRPIQEQLFEKGYLSKEDILQICEQLIEDVNGEIDPGEFDLFRMKFTDVVPIRPKSEFESITKHSSDAYIHRGGLFSIFEVQKQSIIADYDRLLKQMPVSLNTQALNKPFQAISSVPTDPSQQAILHALSERRNLLIQGPPGTGKSQTLTAILVNALENGRRTIVVCEKRTALEVLQQALIDRGLGMHTVLLKDSVKDRVAVVRSVRDRLGLYHRKRKKPSFSRSALEELLKVCQKHIQTINRQHAKLDEKLLDGRNWTETVGRLIQAFRKEHNWKGLPFPASLFQFDPAEWEGIKEIVKTGEPLYQAFSSLPASDFYNPLKFQGDRPFELEQQLQDDFAAYASQLEAIREQAAYYKTEYYKLRKEDFEGQVRSLQGFLQQIEACYTANRYNPDFLDQKRSGGFLYKAISIFSSTHQKTLQAQQMVFQLLKALNQKLQQFIDFDPLPFGQDLRHNHQQLVRLQEQIFDTRQLLDERLRTEIADLDLLEIPAKFRTATYQQLHQKVAALRLQIERDEWTNVLLDAKSYQSFEQQCSHLIERQKRSLEDGQHFLKMFRWYRFTNQLTIEEKQLVEALYDRTDWGKHLYLYYLQSLLQRKGNLELPTDDWAHRQLQQEMGALEKEQLTFIRDWWIYRQMASAERFEEEGDLAVRHLYNKRSSKNHRRLSLRLMVRRDPDLFSCFFPIILVTPNVCSNLFGGQVGYFDLALFDESSQLRLEDTLPAILKGQQKIIAGDRHQMPPSNYFNRIFDGELDDEDQWKEEEAFKYELEEALLACESLLDFGMACQFQPYFLDFHYRSRHPYLIDFSNTAFYGGRLQALPNRKAYRPISFFQVDGIYHQNINKQEIEQVIKILRDHIHPGADGRLPTVGIATLNISQRNQIKRALIDEAQAEGQEAFANKLSQLENDGLFIKNLENIQGDEKDIIILSTTYGPQKDGRFYQRFGPLNHQKGYKLLNVIITRARMQLFVCTSIPPSIYLGYASLLTELGNHRKAVFFAYLAYARAVSEGDNAARKAVLLSLRQSTKSPRPGFAEDATEDTTFIEEVWKEVHPHFPEGQLSKHRSFAGFQIDLLFDPGIANWPGVAIECDGSVEHASPEAYLHDLHRQKILEGHGFVFHRIWSTNWWRDRQAASRQLIEFLQASTQKGKNDRSTAGPIVPD
ncbi:MAG: AAA domain-containing protein [Bacteroidota bacterium]